MITIDKKYLDDLRLELTMNENKILVIPDYKTLCKKVGIEPSTNRAAQLDMMNRFMSVYKDPDDYRQYIIKEIYLTPTKEKKVKNPEGRKRGRPVGSKNKVPTTAEEYERMYEKSLLKDRTKTNGEWAGLVQNLLLKYLIDHNKEGCFTYTSLMQLFGMVNDNYADKNYEKYITDTYPEIAERDIYVFNKDLKHVCVMDVICNQLRLSSKKETQGRLVKNNIIKLSKIFLVSNYGNEFIAPPHLENYILELETRIAHQLGYKNISDMYLRRGEEKYFPMLKNKFKAESGYDGYSRNMYIKIHENFPQNEAEERYLTSLTNIDIESEMKKVNELIIQKLIEYTNKFIKEDVSRELPDYGENVNDSIKLDKIWSKRDLLIDEFVRLNI